MSLSGQQPTLSQGNDSKMSHRPTLLKVRKNMKSKQSLTRRSSRTGSSIGLSRRDMRKKLGNLRVTLDKQETQSKTFCNPTWEAISLLTDMAMTAKLGRRTRPMANAFMNFYDKKFKPVLRNIPVQRDRSTQTARDVIDLTGNKDRERTGVHTYGNDPGVVQEAGDVMPPP